MTQLNRLIMLQTIAYPCVSQKIKLDKIWGYEEWLLSLLDPSTKLQGITNNQEIDLYTIEGSTRFPMIKRIVSKESLSIQVHDKDKPEMWYILDCSSDSYIYLGWSKLAEPLSYKERLQKLNEGDLRILNKKSVTPGSYFYIAPGTVHALGPKCDVLEVSYQSDRTYRLYDYDRRPARELHTILARPITDLSTDYSFSAEEYGSDVVSIDLGNKFSISVMNPGFRTRSSMEDELIYIATPTMVGIPGSKVFSVNHQLIYNPKGSSIDLSTKSLGVNIIIKLLQDEII